MCGSHRYLLELIVIFVYYKISIIDHDNSIIYPDIPKKAYLSLYLIMKDISSIASEYTYNTYLHQYTQIVILNLLKRSLPS